MALSKMRSATNEISDQGLEALVLVFQLLEPAPFRNPQASELLPPRPPLVAS